MPQNCVDSFSCSNQTDMQISKVYFALGNKKNWFNVFVNCHSEIAMEYFRITLQLTSIFKGMLHLIGIINLKKEPQLKPRINIT